MTPPQEPALPRAYSETDLGVGNEGPLTVATTLLTSSAPRARTVRSAPPSVGCCSPLQDERAMSATSAPIGRKEGVRTFPKWRDMLSLRLVREFREQPRLSSSTVA